jgi:hypothetical protein
VGAEEGNTMPTPQRYLLTTHLAAIARLTGLEPGQVDIHKHTWSLVTPVSPAWQPGYWLEFDGVGMGSHDHHPLAWVWVLETRRFPADSRREQSWTARRELPLALVQELLALVRPVRQTF